MKLIHFNGLNCYQDCVISIVNHGGIDYPAAFATFWSETDFTYDAYHRVYLTKKLLPNLKELGANIDVFLCGTPDEAGEILSHVNDGELIIVGMDAYFISWNQFYNTFHGPHYFIAQMGNEETLLCFDPTYDKENEFISRREIAAHAFEIGRISFSPKTPPPIDPICEALEIAQTHPRLQNDLLTRMRECVNAEREAVILLAKYVDGLIRNRYLYRFYLKNTGYITESLLMSGDFFMEWNAVKNGLYKASVSSSNEGVISDICSHFSRLIDLEMSMADVILSR